MANRSSVSDVYSVGSNVLREVVHEVRGFDLPDEIELVVGVDAMFDHQAPEELFGLVCPSAFALIDQHGACGWTWLRISTHLLEKTTGDRITRGRGRRTGWGGKIGPR